MAFQRIGFRHAPGSVFDFGAVLSRGESSEAFNELSSSASQGTASEEEDDDLDGTNEEQPTGHSSRRYTNRSSQEAHPGVVIEDIFVGNSLQDLDSES